MSVTSVSRNILSKLAGQHFGGTRDLYETFGYPRHLTPEDYTSIYLRQDLAARIIDAFPDATWREIPAVDGCDGFEALTEKLNLWRQFHRLDRLTGLGHYGVLLLGLDGGEPMHTPAQSGGGYNLLYVQPHSERTAEITQWEDDPSSPRYGMPKKYRITTGVNWTGSGAGRKSMDVHWTRVIHVAERALEDESIGQPRLERVYNRLMDLDKLLGGSAEVFWQNAAMLRAYVADADVEWSPEEADAMSEQIQEMQNGLRRDMRLRGVEPKELGGTLPTSPQEYIANQLDAIAGAVGVPKRILIGSERGELSSEQDENNWAGRIQERREQHAGPAVIEALIDRCQALGVLPNKDYELEWPESDTLGEQGRAEIAQAKGAAVKAYTSAAGAELVVTPSEFRDWLGLEGDAPVTPEPALDEDDPEVQAQWGER
jgi:hypothetical protein